jgi:hypothetical protein
MTPTPPRAPRKRPAPLSWGSRLAVWLFLLLVGPIAIVAVGGAAVSIPGAAVLAAADCADGSCDTRSSVHSRATSHFEGAGAQAVAGLCIVLGVLAAYLVVSRGLSLWYAMRDQPHDVELSWPIAVATVAYLAFDTALVWALVRWLSS